MTHKIKVQMFGNFRMDYNGAPFVAEKMHKESQFNRMMQALIHYSDCGIAKDKDSICYDAALSECADRQELHARDHKRVSGIARWCRDGRGL